ncbi:MAG: hypothetical protein SPE11_07670 [Parabacteroides sp.]|nr:hypothetical protein [Parabacteroides sp.]
MVRRYPHTAVITVETGHIEQGEYVQDGFREERIQGCYTPNGSVTVRETSDGDEVTVHGEFFTLCPHIIGATRIRIDRVSLDAKIIGWESYQTHSVIYV